MSRQRLEAFLTKLESELSAPGGSEQFRRLKANKRVHTFSYRETTIRKTLIELLNKSTSIDGTGTEILAPIKTELDKELAALTTNIRSSFNSIASSSDTVTVKKGSRSGVNIIVRVLEYSSSRGDRDNFRLIQSAYKEHLDAFYQKFLVLLNQPILLESSSNKSGVRNVDTSGKAFNLEHKKNSSNIKEFINSAILESLSLVYNEKDPEELAILERDLKTLGLKGALQIKKNLKTNEISVYIGSQLRNVEESKAEGKLNTDLQKKLRKALDKLDIVSLEGSDSLKSANRKRIIKKVVSPFEGIKNVKVKTEDLKIKGEKSSYKKDITPGSVSKGSKSVYKPKKGKINKRKETSISSSPLSLINQINRELPVQIRKNMQIPALQNRTGRFSESAKIVGVVQTPRGFPSFQYTYDKYPYQTFEPGYAQGSVERDPRTLINKSIREVAMQYAIGRFYTRRV